MRGRIGVVPVCLLSTLSLVSAFCLSVCKGKAQKAKVETIEGVTYIHNAATPLHPAKTVIFEEELVYRDKDDTGEVRLFRPGGIAVDAQENIYIEDDSDMAIKVFDSEGSFLRAIGRIALVFVQMRDQLLLPGRTDAPRAFAGPLRRSHRTLPFRNIF